MSIDNLKVLYTNADQFLNKVHDLQTFIAGDEPDLILISELLHKNRSVFINISNFMIPGYSLYLNFDSTADTSTTLGIRGVGIFVSKRFPAVQVLFENYNFKDHVWASINLQDHDKLLIGCIYRSPSMSMETSISSLCSLLDCLQGFTHLLICADFNLKDIDWSSMTVHPRNSPFWIKYMTCFFFNMLLNQLVSDRVLPPVHLIWYSPMSLIWLEILPTYHV